MTAVTLDTLTGDERAEVDRLVAANYTSCGWLPVDQVRVYAPGVRIRHRGQQFYEALQYGTGVIITVLQRRNKDVELIVAYDKPLFEGGSRITQLGSYHVDLGPFEAVAR